MFISFEMSWQGLSKAIDQFSVLVEINRAILGDLDHFAEIRRCTGCRGSAAAGDNFQGMRRIYYETGIHELAATVEDSQTIGGEDSVDRSRLLQFCDCTALHPINKQTANRIISSYRPLFQRSQLMETFVKN